MGTLWHDSGQNWGSLHLPSDRPLDGGDVGADGITLLAFRRGGENSTALLVRAGTNSLVNGRPIHDLAVLNDRDEILVGSRRLYFSNESLPTITRFQLADGKRRPNCGVCRGRIADGDEVVVCPRCTRVFHQSTDRAHWTYRSECPFCQHPTSLTGESVWKPEQEDQDVA